MQRKLADLFMDGGGALDVGGIVYQNQVGCPTTSIVDANNT
jgi:hypothetical protein